MARKSFAVIGLGQFGTSLVEQLVANGEDVIAIDIEEENVKKIASFLNTSFVADATDEEALRQLNIEEVDVAIVAFGHAENASILTTVILKQLGVKHIIVRVDHDIYEPIVKKLGADEVIAPQKAAGIGLANRLRSLDYKDFYKLSNDYSVVCIAVREDFASTTIGELRPKEKHGVNVLLIQRKDGTTVVPGGKDEILAGDTVFVVGTQHNINSFRNGINGNNN